MVNPDPIEEDIVSALRRIVRAIDLQSRRMMDACGLTGPQLVVLREVGRLSGASISALARSVSLSQPTVSGILERLEKRGLVRRERSEQDRRSVFVTLTPQGGRTLRDAPSLLAGPVPAGAGAAGRVGANADAVDFSSVSQE